MGNGLGAGSAAAAKLSATAAVVSIPPLWAAVATALLVPRSQLAVISFFTGGSVEPELLGHMRHLLRLLAVLLLCDMFQAGEALAGWWVWVRGCRSKAGPQGQPSGRPVHLPPVAAPTCAVLSGVACGAGKQTRGFAINVVAHWGVSLPCALLLGFHFRLGVEGLQAGTTLGPLLQWAAYAWLIVRLDWAGEAQRAHARMVAQAESTSGAGI